MHSAVAYPEFKLSLPLEYEIEKTIKKGSNAALWFKKLEHTDPSKQENKTCINKLQVC